MSERQPYDELAPQDQIDRIAWDDGLSFDDALDRWCERHPGPTEEPPTRPPSHLCPFGCGGLAPEPGQLHMCPNLRTMP